jgi:hypothetical protein
MSFGHYRTAKPRRVLVWILWADTATTGRRVALLFTPKRLAGVRRRLNDAKTQRLPGQSPNAGGGTRTPDTRIMIPLL